jgi:hypothetical protein
MKKATTSKNEKRTISRKRHSLDVDVESPKIMRTVRDQDAFYFYEAVGKPTGEIARNLSDFLDKVKSIKSESLTFHLQRGDFQNWIEKILGDSKLAGKLKRISSSNGDDIRMSIYRTVEKRIKELKEASVEIHVDDSLAVLVPSF